MIAEGPTESIQDPFSIQFLNLSSGCMDIHRAINPSTIHIHVICLSVHDVFLFLLRKPL